MGLTSFFSSSSNSNNNNNLFQLPPLSFPFLVHDLFLFAAIFFLLNSGHYHNTLSSFAYDHIAAAVSSQFNSHNCNNCNNYRL